MVTICYPNSVTFLSPFSSSYFVANTFTEPITFLSPFTSSYFLANTFTEPVTFLSPFTSPKFRAFFGSIIQSHISADARAHSNSYHFSIAKSTTISTSYFHTNFDPYSFTE